MKFRYSILACGLLTLSTCLHALQSAPLESLEDKVKKELAVIYYDEPVPIKPRLLALGDAKTIGDILLDIAIKNKSARLDDLGLGYLYLHSSVGALGKLREPRAIPLLGQLATADDRTTRMLALQSLGQIDPEGSRDILLNALHDEYGSIHYIAAAALSTVDDPKVLIELDVLASRVQNRNGAKTLQGYADAMRVRLRNKAK
jgi:HEAT repeat protein